MHSAFLASLQGDDWPHIVDASIADDEATIAMVAQPSLTWFEGHFPGHPVLPGVVQVHVASSLGRGLFSIERPFVGIDSLKFQRIITPGRELRLELSYAADSGKLKFAFHDDEGRCSTGCVLFAP